MTNVGQTPGVTAAQGILSVHGLSFGYNGPGRLVLRDLSLEVPEGAVTAILGPNGSGKTTLLRLLLGVLRPGSGDIRIDGRPLWPDRGRTRVGEEQGGQAPERHRGQAPYSRTERARLVGLVPQEEHIPFDFSVLEYVLMGRAPYLSPLEMPGQADYQQATDALRRVGLVDLQHRPLPTLSGGERQLAAVARALAQQTRILLLDEPAAHLDLGNQARLLEIMRGLAAGGATLVLTTHDPNLASAIAGHAVLMRTGQVLASGPADGVFTAGLLSTIYGTPVSVHQVDGRRVILLT
jgi:iron complex transport system ATP-binding protein